MNDNSLNTTFLSKNGDTHAAYAKEFSAHPKVQHLLKSKLNYQFQNPKLLLQAFTHTSYSHITSTKGLELPNNERPEFIGDGVLGLIISTQLLKLYPAPHYDEGKISQFKRVLTEGLFFSKLSCDLELPDLLLCGPNQARDKKTKLPQDVFESLWGAIYLDSNFQKTNDLFLHLYGKRKFWQEQFLEKLSKGPKTLLQEYCLKKFQQLPEYKVIECKKDNKGQILNWKIELYLENKLLATGQGPLKRPLEKKLAKKSLDNFYATL